MSGKGKRFELDTKNNINAATHEWVKAHRPDYSGSSVGEVADLMVVWQANRYSPQQPCGPSALSNRDQSRDGEASPRRHQERHVAYAELKKRSGVDEGNRKVVMSGSSDGQSGVGELEELISESPPWSKQYVGIKFQNRELIVLDAEVLLHWLRRDREGYGLEHVEDIPWNEQYFHGARTTRGDNISMVKPELDWWESSTAGEDDHIKLLHSIGVENYDIR